MAAGKRDYYEALGIDRNASADDIKAAYRKAAMKWHPDRWVGGTDAEKKTAEEKFKEASEAYSILSDPDKKAKYDQFGFAGVDGQGAPDFSGGFGSLDDLLKNIFGGGFGGFSFGNAGFGGSPFGSSSGSSQRVYKGRDIRTRVRLTLDEIASGCEKQVTIERNIPCPDCDGKGTRNSSDIKTCPRCHGTGNIQQTVNSLFGRTVTYTTCPQCGGEGKTISNPCRSCSGTGLVRKRQTVDVKIPAGVEDGMQLTVRGEGHAGQHGGISGDLFVVIEEIPHANLVRDGQNLFYTQVVSVMDAMLGGEISVPCLDGNYKVKLDPGTQSGTFVKLRGKGLPAVSGYGSGRGDMYVKILVWIPRKLSSSQKQLFNSMRGEGEFTPNPNRDDKAIFEKEKKIF